MLKKVGILAAGLVISVSTLCADDQISSTPDTQLYSGGFVAGMGLTTLQSRSWFGGNAGSVFELGYYGPCWMIDIGASAAGTPKFGGFAGFILGHLGLRNRICQNLFVSYGVMGLGHIVSKKTPAQWSVGAFTGLDYQFTRHFMLSGKIYPYNYDHRRYRCLNNILANGTISLLYVF